MSRDCQSALLSQSLFKAEKLGRSSGKSSLIAWLISFCIPRGVEASKLSWDLRSPLFLSCSQATTTKIWTTRATTATGGRLLPTIATTRTTWTRIAMATWTRATTTIRTTATLLGALFLVCSSGVCLLPIPPALNPSGAEKATFSPPQP